MKSDLDWSALERLRGEFLAGTAGGADYWTSESDLASYDETFGARIRSKWNFVLAELESRGWVPPRGPLLDWGCGSGIATRAFLVRFGSEAVSRSHLWDRSALAMRFAAERVRAECSPLPVQIGDPPDASSATLLVSHVLTELAPEALEPLLECAERARTVLWLEPGTFPASRALLAVRERLRPSFRIVAPCTHDGGCGLLAPGNELHWCHQFATPEPEVFTDGDWARFGRRMGVDLRSLPVSHLVLDRREVAPLPPGAVRVIGRPKLRKGHALVLGCDASGVHERRLLERDQPESFRRLVKGKASSLQVWRREGDRVVESGPALA